MEMLQWVDLNNVEMWLFDLQISLIWRKKFVEIRDDLENVEGYRLGGSTVKISANALLNLMSELHS
jgi:hypothetical protein